MSTDTSRPTAAAGSAPAAAPAGTRPQGLETVSVRQTRRVTGIAFLAWTIAVYDFILFGTLLPDISRDFGWDTSEALLVSTLVSVGTAVVVLLVGPMVDRLGRRIGMVVSVTGTAMSSGATALSAGAVSLVGIRSISGLGLAEQSINATYLNEIYEQTEDERIRRNKGFVYAIVQTGWPIGALLAAAFATLITSVFGPGQWRIAFGLATVPALLVAAICLTLRESPQFVAQQQIRRLKKGGHEAEAAALARATGLDVQKSAPLARIFQGKHLRSTIVLSAAWLLNWFGIQTFSVLGTTVLESGKHIDASNALVLIIASNCVGVLGYLVHGWLGDRLGRRNVIVGGWSIAGLAFAVMLLGPNDQVFVMGAYMVGLFFLLGPYAAILFFQAGCFDSDCRATGSSFIGAMSQPGAIIGGFLLTGLTAGSMTFGTAALWVGAGGILASAVIMLLAKPTGETRDAAPVTATAGAAA